MSNEVRLPDENERRSFLHKLGQFRQTLPPNEQEMLDVTMMTTFAPLQQGEVQGYTWFWSNNGPAGPGWYNTGWTTNWINTPYQNTAYSLNPRSDGKYLP